MVKQVHFQAKSIAFTFLLAGILILPSCGKESIEMFDCTGSTPTYTIEVKPILDASCAKSGCHDTQTHENGFDFSSYGEARIASQTENFLGAIQHKGGFEPMPDDGPKLSADKIKILTCWAQNGSPE
ncbi:MAG TPA: hypothetical protein VFG10_12140 [Saprospiraceae bacterium]|nr:hypothetical protein [Saprospiraceae bacterium]